MSADPKSESSFALSLLAIAIGVTVFLFDIMLPLGVAGGVPYVALVFFGWWFLQRDAIFLLAIVSSVLVVAGYYFSPEGGVLWIVLTNRAYALLAVWGTAIALWIARKSRTLTLQSEAQLELALHKAECANRAKSDLLANMSHELRTPLNAIIGFSSTMREEIFGPLGNDKYKGYISDIHQSGHHLLELINDILDTSALEAGALKLKEVNVDLPKVVDAAVRLIQTRADDGQVKVTVFMEAPPRFMQTSAGYCR